MKYLILLFICLAGTAFSQKKVIDHTAYNDWKRVGDTQISNDGKYVSYTIKPHRGDGYTYLVNVETNKVDSFFRAVDPKFTDHNSYFVFKITPGFDTLRTCELNKVKKEKWPKDSLGVYHLASQKLQKHADIKAYYLLSESDQIVFLKNSNELKEKAPSTSKKKKAKKKKKIFCKKKNKEEPVKVESDGGLMYVVDGEAISKPIKNVKDIYTSEKGIYFAYTTHQKVKKADSISMHAFNFIAQKSMDIQPVFSNVGGLSFNSKGNELAFTASVDTSKAKNYQLFHVNLEQEVINKLIDTLHVNLPETDRVSSDFKPQFSENGEKLYFGVAEKAVTEPKDTLLASEKAVLDVWHWKDARLQPQQLVELKRDLKKSNLAVYELAKKSFLILGEEDLRISLPKRGNPAYLLGYSVSPYQNTYNWEYPYRMDIYKINVATGNKTQVLKAQIFGADLSPSGNYMTYFKEKDKQQYVLDFATNKEVCITCSVKTDWFEDINGMPIEASPLGVIGWEKGENSLLIQSKYDVYRFDLPSQNIKNITKGEAQKIRYTLRDWDRDSIYVSSENSYLVGFYESDKSMSVLRFTDNNWTFDQKLHTNHKVMGLKKAKNAETYIFQASSIQDYPDVQVGKWISNEAIKQISWTNPQQSEYNWATVELIKWKAYDKTPLEGLLYKPENYDSTKKYPLLVYFYEMYSDDLHNHYAPKPTASIIFATEYASAGYFVLIPDIRYEPGFPARGAYNCIMSATDYVLKNYPAVDSTKMGLQGQSWGGYQTAQLITMTNRFHAAMAGAPVANMFSAYGGIRWGTGLNRQFQYERTQSRIGKTIWEAPELYVENSPLFHLPKVNTPLLIMHNDADGAVPWYQGIELFTGLKRLNKPVWMLNYNGDDHNLMKNANRIDLSIRMRQFFDFYLKDVPAPTWLENGLPAKEKGKSYGLERE
ncbi:MAG: prolyl oligopeptidase family serine peptidase [Crocinitomicaceae bacterium]|nr:prolyl oligopeptidase family serine peptidase [Crocinitomicaceae bacterium]